VWDHDDLRVVAASYIRVARGWLASGAGSRRSC